MLKLELKTNKELDVFTLTMKFGTSTEGSNMREVLGGNVFLIRFPTMTADEISDSVLPCDVLTPNEGLQVLCYLTTKSSKPSHLPFSTEPRCRETQQSGMATTQVSIDKAPRSLVIPAPYVNHEGNVPGGQPTMKQITLKCQISRPILLKKIFFHAPSDDQLSNHFTLHLIQNGRILHKYNGQPSIIPEQARMPRHFAVDVNDVRVESGAIELNVVLTSVNNRLFHNLVYTLSSSVLTTSQLSDDYVVIDFSPVEGNLLQGIEYSPVI